MSKQIPFQIRFSKDLKPASIQYPQISSTEMHLIIKFKHFFHFLTSGSSMERNKKLRFSFIQFFVDGRCDQDHYN